MSEEKKLKTTEHVVAFIDLLKAKEMIMGEGEDEFLNLVHETYKKTYDEKKSYDAIYTDKLSIRIFSDNILLFIPTNGKLHEAFWFVCEFAIALQGEFLENNILVRGGISFGNFSETPIMCWGKALVQSYELESKVAIYPRIVIDPEFYRRFNPDNDEPHQSLTTDNDGMVYLDYLIYGYENPSHLPKLKGYLEDIREEISKYSSDAKTLQKLYWHENYIERKITIVEEKINAKNEK